MSIELPPGMVRRTELSVTGGDSSNVSPRMTDGPVDVERAEDETYGEEERSEFGVEEEGD